MPLSAVVRYLDFHRQTDSSDTIENHGNSTGADSRSRSLALRNALLTAVEKLDPDLADTISGPQSLTTMYEALPDLIKLQLDFAHRKLVAKRRLDIALGFASRLIFFKAGAMQIDKNLTGMTTRMLKIIGEKKDQDFSDPSFLGSILRSGLEAFPVPDPLLVSNNSYDAAYLDFQNSVHQESLRLATVA